MPVGGRLPLLMLRCLWLHQSDVLPGTPPITPPIRPPSLQGPNPHQNCYDDEPQQQIVTKRGLYLSHYPVQVAQLLELLPT
ncbi:hypothetical protein B0H66DRAFT_559052 [Apodospora peruviana]|uniref:Secreted protein n=1 Tax=Apodospora peruviana TaxID=516989 RepID=A0AAE0M5B3_9PEZI|nr:hypothetical protein B0H66DRAFT_559052 [Apodospora peruviana]